MIDQEEALLASFQVRHILIDRVLEAQMNDEESQELIQVVSERKKKDLWIREFDNMLMQESRMYMPNIAELKKDILDEAHISAYAMHLGSTKIYHSSIGMSPFEALYGKSCYTSLSWSEVGERVLVGLKIFDEITQNIQLSPWKSVVWFGKKEINPDLTYDEEPVRILDWKDKVLRNKTVHMVKVLWRNHSGEEATWETEDRLRDMYPCLFYEY
ncbi:uncharacterized protein [Pyrus communis]|uniref:uncharacterized protein n=1 Tax=Pyrus communis TaxID=23211 RepID=UPI0035C22E6B